MLVSELSRLKNHEDFMALTTRYGVYCAKEFMDIFQLRLDRMKDKGMYDWYAGPYFAEFTSNFRFRFTTIEFPDGDEVLCGFYLVHTAFVKYNRLSFVPISKNCDIGHENFVLEFLFENDIVKNLTEYYEYENDSFNYSICNYYADVEEEYKHINRGKWKSKHVNSVLRNYNITFEDYNSFDRNYIESLNTQWNKYMKDILNKNLVKGFLDYLDNVSDPNVYAKVLKVDGSIIGITEGTFEFGEYATQHIIKHIGPLTLSQVKDFNYDLFFKLTEVDIEFIQKRISDVLWFYTINYLHDKGVKYVYAGSGGDKDASLNIQKEKYYKHKITQRIYDKSDYKELIHN